MKLEKERSRKIWREVRVRCFSLLVLRRQKIRRGSRRNGEGEGGRRQIFSWFWVCVRVCLSTCHAECDNKIADTSLRMPRKPREKWRERERRAEEEKSLVAVILQLLFMHFQRKTEKTTQSKHKNATSGRKMRFPCLLGKTTRAKGHDECCCKSAESNNYSATWKTGRSAELIYAWECDAFNYQQLLRVALFLFQCIICLSLCVYFSLSFSLSLLLMLHIRHSFGYSQYRRPPQVSPVNDAYLSSPI